MNIQTGQSDKQTEIPKYRQRDRQAGIQKEGDTEKEKLKILIVYFVEISFHLNFEYR